MPMNDESRSNGKVEHTDYSALTLLIFPPRVMRDPQLPLEYRISGPISTTPHQKLLEIFSVAARWEMFSLVGAPYWGRGLEN